MTYVPPLEYGYARCLIALFPAKNYLDILYDLRRFSDKDEWYVGTSELQCVKEHIAMQSMFELKGCLQHKPSIM